MLNNMLRTALLGVSFCIPVAYAVYSDEINKTDWQLEPLGEYRCVLPSEKNNLLVLADHGSDSTLFSLVSGATGDIISRLILPIKVDDAMLIQENNTLVIKSLLESGEVDDTLYLAYDSLSGLQLSEFDTSTIQFTSSCNPLDSENVKLSESSLQLLDTASNLPIFKVDLPDDFEEVKYLKTDNSNLLELVLKTSDMKYHYYSYSSGGTYLKNSWVRDESLASVADYFFLETKDHSLDTLEDEILLEGQKDDLLSGYLFRLRRDIDRFSALLRRNQYLPWNIISELLQLDSLDVSETELTHKQKLKFGLSKLLVVVTKNGQLQAMDLSGQGKVVWTLNTGLSDVVSMFWDESSGKIVIFSSNGSYNVYSLSSELFPPTLHTQGKSEVSADLRVISVKSLKTTGIFIFKFENGSLKVVIPDPSNIHADNLSEPLFVTDHTDKKISGHMLSLNTNDEGNLKVDLLNTWKIGVDDINEEIVAFTPRGDEPIVNMGHILGNRTVLYKYTYPNLASYIVLNKSTGNMFVNLIDTVTGELYYSQRHVDEGVDCRFPIKMVFTENWLVYSYFSSVPLPEQKLTVIELFESLTPNERVSNDVTEYNPLRNNVNKPKAISKSYLYPEIISNLGLSNTKFDITTRVLLIESERGQVAYVPRFVLSARRKEESKLSNDDKKEFMPIPYIPIIPINDYFTLSHGRELILGPESKLVSSPTNLESTSFVCDIGHDIFCTKIMPSGQFDLMAPTFERTKLVLTVLALVGVCIFLRPKVATKRLKLQWLSRG